MAAVSIVPVWEEDALVFVSASLLMDLNRLSFSHFSSSKKRLAGSVVAELSLIEPHLSGG